MTSLPEVAKKVFFECKKCACERYQVVIAHVTATSARLECEVCKTKNSFKLEEPKRTRSIVPKKKAPSAKVAAGLAARWGQLRDHNSVKPMPYNMKLTFETGAAVDHPKFGLGFVIGVSGSSIQVVFEDAERSLVHSRT
jgi:hypothetical protein